MSATSGGATSAPALALCEPETGADCIVVDRIAAVEQRMSSLDDSVRIAIAYAEADRKLIKAHLDDVGDLLRSLLRERRR